MFLNLRLKRDPDPAAASAGGAAPAPAKQDVTPVPTDPQSAKATIPSSADPLPTPDDKKYSFFEAVPPSYKDKPYLKDVQNFEQLFKKLDGAQELIGKRPAGIPGKDSKPEEVASFYKMMGKPDTADGYEFEDVKLPEGIKRDEELAKFTKGLFHQANLTAEQAKIVQSGFEKKMVELAGNQQPDPAMSDEAFDQMTKDIFKDRADTVLKNGSLLLAENMPPELKANVEKLDNNALLVLSAVLDGIRERYISEDALPREGDAKGGTDSVDDLRQQARVLMARPEYTSKGHKDHANVKAEVDAIYARIARLEARK